MNQFKIYNYRFTNYDLNFIVNARTDKTKDKTDWIRGY